MIALNFLLLFYLVLLSPKLFFDRFLRGKRHPHLLQRLGWKLPPKHLFQGKELFWIHAVSVGEVKAARPLFEELKKRYPNVFFLITTTTATGQEEAHRSLSAADAFAYFPLDFSWSARRFAFHLRPKLFLLIEGDLWPHLLAAIKRAGGKTVLASGKLSERSFKRYRFFSFLSQQIFKHLDLLCVQNEEHARRFRSLLRAPSRLSVTGNLKLAAPLSPPFDVAPWREKLSLSLPAVAITCTHAREEEAILDALFDLDLFFFLAPRHPERFNEVASLLRKKKRPFFRWTELEQRKGRGGERILLVDAMGQLSVCYQLSRLALVGGSFVPNIGGHNIFEPCLFHLPVFFGPYMSAQKELVKRVLDARAGCQLSLSQLKGGVASFFSHQEEEKKLKKGVQNLLFARHEIVQKTLESIEKFLDANSST